MFILYFFTSRQISRDGNESYWSGLLACHSRLGILASRGEQTEPKTDLTGKTERKKTEKTEPKKKTD